MQSSRRRGVSDILFDSLLGRDSRLLRERSITDSVSDVKNSFSSWDSCMDAVYCKWPVIAVIIVGGLIVFSVLWCCIRCACCGMSCCCTCFSFLKCCDCCGGSCDGKKNKPHKHLDDPHDPRNGGGFGGDKGYQAPPPMMGGGLNSGPAQTTGLITSRDPPGIPQYAQFEVGKNGLYVEPKPVSDDALPPMPSWETATRKQVANEEKDAVELSNLEPTTSQNVPLMTGAVSPATNQPPSPAANLPTNPYGLASGSGYMNVPPQSRSPVNQQGGFNAAGGYRGGPSPGPGRGGPPRNNAAPMPGYGQRGQDMNKGYGGNYGAPQHQDQYGNDEYMGAVIGDGYGRQRQNQRGNFRPQPQTNYSSDSSRPLNPGRGYSDRSYEERSPGQADSGGFDFGQQAYPPQQSYPPQQQYSQPPPPQQVNRRPVPRTRPSADDYMNYDGETAPPSYRSGSPEAPVAYPGYKPYTPPPGVGRVPVGGRLGGGSGSGGGSGGGNGGGYGGVNGGGRGGEGVGGGGGYGRGVPEALSPGGRGREARGWDPVQ
ncbi:hypothetical protein GLAREA_01254 [Glarea lozoyensis ATCC 20868]|uniref:Fibroin-3 related protein n=1 Tax=Glarea lozoyensis (strain ATCC 20868 / MF5171) TaxID=1116229 RepID=S3CFS6_GLAL2|nr:uncharacterized protein GLAREA_01254 [Glarea lozoyensis ATCC 20868]EPE25342.1 hypothetical protein GLAREA_01254 [Glarea lozoyensis ATCC 20868]